MPQKTPKVTIILRNFKAIDKPMNYLRSLQNTNYPNFEIILVDCCTPEYRIFQEKFPIKLIHFEKDIGATKEHNIAFKTTEGSDFILFTDNDLEVEDPDWLKKLIKIMQENPNVGVIQPLLRNIPTRKIESLGGYMDSIGYVDRSFLNQFRKNLYRNGIYSIFYGETAVILWRRSVIKRFKPRKPFLTFPQHFEDLDICWRTLLSGYKIVSTTDVAFFHHRGMSSKINKGIKDIPLYTRNRLDLLTKYYGLKNFVTKMPIHLFLEMFKSIYLTLRHNATQGLGTIRGIIWYFKDLRKIWKLRVEVQKNRVVSDKKLKHLFTHFNLARLLLDFEHHFG